MSKFTESGIREINFALEDEAILELKNMWKSHVKEIPEYPEEQFEGQGIVMCAGGISYFTCAWICISNLRNLGCTLPVELWYLGNELTEEAIGELKKLDVDCRNFIEETQTTMKGFSLKPLAIIKSKFQHVLFLDADNNCLRDPSFLFNGDEYISTGTIFWPDFWKTAVDNPIWKIVESTSFELYEQESGQLVINKETSWLPLNLALFFNEKKQYFHMLLYGDKDTFKFAWHALKQDFFMITTPVACCGYSINNEFFGTTMVQYDFEGNELFLHRNLLKWDNTKDDEYNLWTQINRFNHLAVQRSYKFDYNNINRHLFLRLEGDSVISNARVEISELENRCLIILKKLREATFYHRFLIESLISAKRS